MNDKVNAMTFSIEKEREEYHLRKRKRKMVKLYISLVMWALIIAFLCTPFASYRGMSVNGNVYLSEEEIINYAGIKYSWWWVIDSDKVRKKLEEHENIDNVSRITIIAIHNHIGMLFTYFDPIINHSFKPQIIN